MKKIFITMIILMLSLSFTACVQKKDDVGFDDAVKTQITFYVDESNTYGKYVKGSDENSVKDAIERKFYADTGEAINLNIMYQSHDNFNTVFPSVMTTGLWDAAVSYIGQAGLDEIALSQNVAMDLKDLIDLYGENITQQIDAQAMWSTTLLDNQIIGIPSVSKTKTKGILVRKDLMNKVGYTSEEGHNDNLGDIGDSANGKLKTLYTIDDFTDMLRRLRAQGICTMPLIGNAYDIEFTLTPGATGSLGYQYRSVNYNEDGTVKEVVPGWLSQNYNKVLNYEYLWQREQLWESDNTTKSEERRIQDFTNGKGAVYCVDPNILNLIGVARKVKQANENAEFEILKPLDGVDSDGKRIVGSGAFAEMSRTVDCMIINKKSKNAEKIIKYMNWLYASKDNYELCAYGIKDVHWVDSGEGYYSYPNDMADRYISNPPYSGVFALLHNDEFSYRLYDGYSEQERAWINIVENANTMKNLTDGMLFNNMTATDSVNFQTAENEMYEKCATLAWNASANPIETYPIQAAKYRQKAGSYITWLTQQYKLYVAQRS